MSFTSNEKNVAAIMAQRACGLRISLCFRSSQCIAVNHSLTFSLLIDQVLLRESSMRRETGNQFINAAGNEGPGDFKIVADRGALIPTLFRYGGREPPSGVAGERHDQAGVGELLGSDQSGMVLPDIDAVALQAGDNIFRYLRIGFGSGRGRAKRQVSLDRDAIEIFRRDQALGRAVQTNKCNLLRTHVVSCYFLRIVAVDPLALRDRLSVHKVAIRFAALYHLPAIRIERVVDDPLRRILSM